MINAKSKDELLLPPSEQNTAADFVLEFLSHINVDKIFGIPGGAIEPLFDAVSHFNRNNNGPQALSSHQNVKSKIELITSRHEAGAVFMADGYARETGHLAVCCATTGPGSTNMITGIASAYIDHIPMLILTPQTPMSNFGQQNFQDSCDDSISIVTMLSRCTRYNSMVTHVDQLKYKLTSALKAALTYPRGPVHLSIPADIWKDAINVDINHCFADFSKLANNGYDKECYEDLCQLMTSKKKLLFLLGAESLPFAKTIISCAELLGADIVTTPTAKGCINANHPQYKGVLGFAGHLQAEDALLDSDVDHIVVIGTHLHPFETANLCNDSSIVKKMLYINHSMADGLMFESAHLLLTGNMKSIFRDLEDYLTRRQIIEAHRSRNSPQSISNVLHYDRITQNSAHIDFSSLTYVDQPFKNERVKPQYLMSQLPGILPEASRFFIDTGNSWAWATHYMHLNSVSNYHIAMNYGAMGWAIGAAVGAAFVKENSPTVCITGDGSYLMNGQEITVAVQHQLPVIFVILNDNGYGMVKHGQRMGGAEEIGYELPHVDFAMMARAVGATGVTVRHAQDLDELDMKALLSGGGPLLLDIHIDPEEVPPMGSRIRELEKA